MILTTVISNPHLSREVDLYYPKRPDVPTYKSLLKSAELSGVNIIDSYNLSRVVDNTVDIHIKCTLVQFSKTPSQSDNIL